MRALHDLARHVEAGWYGCRSRRERFLPGRRDTRLCGSVYLNALSTSYLAEACRVPFPRRALTLETSMSERRAPAARLTGKVLTVVVAAALSYLTFRNVNPRAALASIQALGASACFLLVPSLLAVIAEARAWQTSVSVFAGRPSALRLAHVRVVTESTGDGAPVRCAVGRGRQAVPLATPLRLLAVGQPHGDRGPQVPPDPHPGRLRAARARARPPRPHARLAEPHRVVGASLVGPALGALLARPRRRHGAIAPRRTRVAAVARHARAHPDRTTARGASSEDGASSNAPTSTPVRFFGSSQRLALEPLLLTLFGWMMEAAETWLILSLLGQNLDFGSALAVEATVVFVRHLLFMLPAGIGAQELGYAALFGALGVGLEASAAFALLKRGRELLWAAVGYGLFLLDTAQRAARAKETSEASRGAGSRSLSEPPARVLLSRPGDQRARTAGVGGVGPDLLPRLQRAQGPCRSARRRSSPSRRTRAFSSKRWSSSAGCPISARPASSSTTSRPFRARSRSKSKPTPSGRRTPIHKPSRWRSSFRRPERRKARPGARSTTSRSSAFTTSTRTRFTSAARRWERRAISRSRRCWRTR